MRDKRVKREPSVINHDIIEDDPVMQIILEIADAGAEAELAHKERGLGYCHSFWFVKKRILKEKYQIDWKTPAEMNPQIDFD